MMYDPLDPQQQPEDPEGFATPGPWQVYEGGDWLAVGPKGLPDKPLIADIIPEDPGQSAWSETDRANALLMAQAHAIPALRAVAETVAGWPQAAGECAVVDAARAALALLERGESAP